MRKAVVFFAGLVIVGTALLWREYQAFLGHAMISDGPQMRLEVRPGDSVRAVVMRLESMGVTRRDWRWRLLLRLDPVTIQAGEYWLEAGMSPPALLDRLARGDVIQYRFTIVEGWTYRQLREALLAAEALSADPGFLGADEVMQVLGSDQPHPEGWFLPETYAYVRGDSVLDLLGRAHQSMRDALAAVWAARSLELILSDPYELLILASIVEKESAQLAERPAVAGVFVRRLRAGWRLETDPTVIYGLGREFDGDIRRRDLKADTPYNTYTRHGLPPTPIAMPSRASLEASAKPAEGSAMFFVADGTGGHVFSDTLEEHNAAVQSMLQRRGRNQTQGQGH